MADLSLGGDGLLGKRQLSPAARTDCVVKLDDPSATGALTTQLAIVRAVEDRGQQPKNRHRRGNKKPQKERGALSLANSAADHPKQHRDRDVAEVLNRNRLLQECV